MKKGYDLPYDHIELSHMLEKTVVDFSQKYKRTNTHLDHFLSSKCAADILSLNTFPQKNAAKEITESIACLKALFILRKKQNCLDDKETIVYIIGDGRKPRTGICAAFFTRLRIVSIDPNMNTSYINYIEEKEVRNLLCVPKRIEDLSSLYDIPDNWRSNNSVLIFPHSHASIQTSLKCLAASCKRVDVISLPCCKKDDLAQEPNITYVDHGVHSPKNVVNIYENVR